MGFEVGFHILAPSGIVAGVAGEIFEVLLQSIKAACHFGHL